MGGRVISPWVFAMCSTWWISWMMALGANLAADVDDPAKPTGTRKATESMSVSAGTAVDYGAMAFYPQRWKDLGQRSFLYPWHGQHIVLLTSRNNLDPKIMRIFLHRLDGAWSYYAKMVGKSPQPAKMLLGKATIAAVPDGGLTCGYGCGMVGATGIEVAGFDSSDYSLVVRFPREFPHYYFYEMGRNYYVFGNRHSSFVTGFAVFMRYCCMDALNCIDNEPKLRGQIERAEAHYSQGNMSFVEAFTIQGGLSEKVPRLPILPGPSDQPVIYASAMLKLYREHGGDDWLKRFFRQLATCPEIQPDNAARALSQSLAWLVAASVAAGEDLSPVFVDRWRFPMGPTMRQAMKVVPWKRQGLTAAAVLESLPRDFTK